MKHILIHITHECNKDYTFKRIYEILRDEYHSFWEHCTFIDGKSIIVRGSWYEDFKIHFLSNYMNAIGIVPIKEYNLECSFDNTISKLVRDLIEDCEYYGIFSKEEISYMKHDVEQIKEVWDKVFNNKKSESPSITKVLYSDPATIVFWDDGTKTVVKCQKDDKYSYAEGIMYAIIRKMFGNNKQYSDILKWISMAEEYDKTYESIFKEEDQNDSSSNSNR